MFNSPSQLRKGQSRVNGCQGLRHVAIKKVCELENLIETVATRPVAMQRQPRCLQTACKWQIEKKKLAARAATSRNQVSKRASTYHGDGWHAACRHATPTKLLLHASFSNKYSIVHKLEATRPSMQTVVNLSGRRSGRRRRSRRTPC